MEQKEAFSSWVHQFLKHRDLVTRTLQSVEKNVEGYDLKAVHSTKEVFVIVEPFLTDFSLIKQKIQPAKDIVLFVFNTKENVDIIIQHWKELIGYDKLMVYFVNMRALGDTHWALKPYVHHRISDDKSLKTGLYSLFATVEPVA